MEPMTLTILFAVAYFSLYIFAVLFIKYDFPFRNRIEDYAEYMRREAEYEDDVEYEDEDEEEEERQNVPVPEWLSCSRENTPLIKEEVERRYNLFYNTIVTPGMMRMLQTICFGDFSILKIVPAFYLDELPEGKNVTVRLDVYFTSGKTEEFFLEASGNTFTEAAREILSSLVYEFGYDNSPDLNAASCYTVFPFPTTDPTEEKIYLPELLLAYTKAFDQNLEDPVEDFYERIALIALEAREAEQEINKE